MMRSSDELRRALASLGSSRERDIICHDEIDSTSTALKRRLEAGAPPGTVVTAGRQHAGRGRQGRTWCSGDTKNLYLSLAVHLNGPPRDTVLMVPLAAGIAAHDAIRSACGLETALKWPNDVLSSDRKLAGILCETASLKSDSAVAVVGIGVNVGQTRFPDEIADIATSIAIEHDTVPNLDELAARFINSLESLVPVIEQGKSASIVEPWLVRAEPFGRFVRVGDVAGTTVGLTEEGKLILETPENELVHISGGIVETVG